ncbi:MAG: hypothetical protein H9Q65_00765 [Spiroplasma ixodetis]|nr:hypothetical protein [Spiroplasma ixodetis]MBP1526500.1 hypothetical protein [Spiroplasma ixodetis]MBP1527775.1 hypothetical protein [Spiroplasma ixodetis]
MKINKEETWTEVQWALNNLHGPIRAGALSAQNWSNTTTGVLLTIAGLKSVTRDSNIEKRYQLIKSGVADMLYAAFGGWVIWQAYNLNETGGSTTTEPNLPTFPTLPPNDERLYSEIAEQLTEDAVSNELTPEMISIALNKLFTGTNGLVKVLSGISGFDLYKIQKVTKTIEYLKSLTTFATAGINFTNGNIVGGNLMSISAMMDVSHTYFSTMSKSNTSNSKEEIIIKIINERKEHITKSFSLYKGILSNKDLKEIYEYLEKNNWDKFEMRHSDKTIPSFVKPGKIKDWRPTLTKFKEWIDNYTPENKKVELVTEIEDSSQRERIKLKIPDYEFEPAFVTNANNDMPEVIIEPNERQPLLGSINS